MSCQQASQYLASSNNCPIEIDIDNDNNLNNNQNNRNNSNQITNRNLNNSSKSKNKEKNININSNNIQRSSLSCDQRHTTASRRQRPRRGLSYGTTIDRTTNRNESDPTLNPFAEDNDPYVFNEPVPTAGEVLSFQEQVRHPSFFNLIYFNLLNLLFYYSILLFDMFYLMLYTKCTCFLSGDVLLFCLLLCFYVFFREFLINFMFVY